MSTILDAIQAEREQLLAPIADKLKTLDELERLAAALNGTEPAPGAPASSPRKGAPKPAAAQKRGRGLDGLSDQARAALAKLRAAGRPLSRPEIGASSEVMANLVRRELAIAHGENRGRRYTAAIQSDGAAAATPPRIAPPAAPAADAQPAAPADALTANQSRVLRSRILDHLSRRRLNELSLTDHLNADREHVADILGKLLTDEKIVLDPDGCYRVPA